MHTGYIEQIFVGIACLIHIYIFVMESLLWGRPTINKTFAMSAETASQNLLFAFNQGFYNLFLAIGAAIGIWLGLGGVATCLKAYSCLSMVGAAIVLICSEPKLMRPALIQGLPPLIGMIALGIRVFG